MVDLLKYFIHTIVIVYKDSAQAFFASVLLLASGEHVVLSKNLSGLRLNGLYQNPNCTKAE